MAIGMSDGSLAIYDCAKAAKLRSAQVSTSPIKAIAFFNKSNNQVLISSADLGVSSVTIAPKIELTAKPQSPEKKRNKKREIAPELLRISPSDKHVLSGHKNGTLSVRSLETEESKDQVSWSVAAH